jgi:hypothetical protein
MELVMPAAANVAPDDFELALAGVFILESLSSHHTREAALFTDRRAPAVLLSLLNCFTLPLAEHAAEFAIVVTLLSWVLKHEECAPIDPQVIPCITRLVEGGLAELSMPALQDCLNSILFDLVQRVEDSAPAPAKMQQFMDAGGIQLIQKAMRLHCLPESYLPYFWTSEVLRSDVGRAAFLAAGGMDDVLNVMRRTLQAQSEKMLVVALGPLGYRFIDRDVQAASIDLQNDLFPHHDFMAAFREAGGDLVLAAAAHAYPENIIVVSVIELIRRAYAALDFLVMPVPLMLPFEVKS